MFMGVRYIVFDDEYALSVFEKENAEALRGIKYSIACRDGYMNSIEFHYQPTNEVCHVCITP